MGELTEDQVFLRKWLRSLVAVLAAVVIAGAGLIAMASSDEPETELPDVPSTVSVTYEVEGESSSDYPYADLTMSTPTGTEQITADLPLTNQAGGSGLTRDFPRGAHVYIAAQMSESGTWVTCRIKVGETVISENTSRSRFGIATCSGTAG